MMPDAAGLTPGSTVMSTPVAAGLDVLASRGCSLRRARSPNVRAVLSECHTHSSIHALSDQRSGTGIHGRCESWKLECALCTRSRRI